MITDFPTAVSDRGLDRFWQPPDFNHAEPCAELPKEIDCPCCQGAGEHAVGAGPETRDYLCQACAGHGLLALSQIVTTPSQKEYPDYSRQNQAERAAA